LAETGYNARWIVLGADNVGARHKRKRLWILAYCKSEYAQPVFNQTNKGNPQAQFRRLFISKNKIKAWEKTTHNTKPYFVRGYDGMAIRVDRLKAIGNGQVPQCAATAWEILKGSL
jgi:DNA (cytosine-5)-methyltransferase 1